MDHVARADDVQQVLRIIGVRGIFHRIEVIQVAKEFVEAVDRRQEFIQVAQMILAELAGGVPLRFERGGNRASLGRQSGFGACLADGGHAGADGELARDEVRAAGRATGFRVVIGEQHSLFGQLVEIRRPAGHQPAVISADIPHADIIAHDEHDVRLFAGAGGLGFRIHGALRSAEPVSACARRSS